VKPMTKSDSTINNGHVENGTGYGESAFQPGVFTSGESMIFETKPLVWPGLFNPVLILLIGLAVYLSITYFEARYPGPDEIIWLTLRWFGVGIMALSLLSFLVRSLKWWSTVYGITNKRILLKTGIIGRSYVDCSLSKVHNLQVDIPVHGRLLGFGTVRIVTVGSGTTEIEWANVRDPLRVQRELNEAVERFTHDGHETAK